MKKRFFIVPRANGLRENEISSARIQRAEERNRAKGALRASLATCPAPVCGGRSVKHGGPFRKHR